jgi:predicted membrane chloride channel (bestrophin family)
MKRDSQREYGLALTGYRRALLRLREAKRHLPETARDRRRRLECERRAEERAYYLAHRAEIDERCNRVTAQALAVLHQKLNSLGEPLLTEAETLRIRMPISYRVINNQG